MVYLRDESSNVSSTRHLNISQEGFWLQAAGLLWVRKHLAFPHTAALRTGHKVTRPETNISAQCNQPFLVQTYCIVTVIIQHFHFPLLSSWALSQLSEMFFYHCWKQRGLYSYQGDCWVAALSPQMELLDMNHGVIAVFMNTNNSNAHMAVGAYSIQVSLMLPIIVNGFFSLSL